MSAAPTSKTTDFWSGLAERGIGPSIDAISHEEAIRLTEYYGTHNYHPLEVTVARGEGCYIQDANGKEFIDCIGSYSAMAHGHLSEFMVKAATDQLSRLTLTSRAVYTRELALFLKALCEYTEMEMACPMNAGAEAVETAIKVARKWAYTVKGVEDNEAEIIVANENFHGRTTTIISFSSEPNYKRNFGPFTPGFRLVPFGDLEAIRAAITPKTAAILLEPIQAEAGILMPPNGYMEGIRELCDRERIALIWDEIQTGFCRTGRKFAWQYEAAQPDMMCLGKALGGGLFPVSAVVGKQEFLGVLKPGDHGSTFGGNPLAATIGIAAMAELEMSNLCANSFAMGELLREGFLSIGHPAIEEVRGRGLLVGLEVKQGTDTATLQQAFLDEGVLTKETRHRTFRFAPPLVISPAIVDDVVRRTKHAFQAL